MLTIHDFHDNRFTIIASNRSDVQYQGTLTVIEMVFKPKKFLIAGERYYRFVGVLYEQISYRMHRKLTFAVPLISPVST